MNATDDVSGFASGLAQPIDLDVSYGDLYYLARGDGSVYRIQRPG